MQDYLEDPAPIQPIHPSIRIPRETANASTPLYRLDDDPNMRAIGHLIDATKRLCTDAHLPHPDWLPRIHAMALAVGPQDALKAFGDEMRAAFRAKQMGEFLILAIFQEAALCGRARTTESVIHETLADEVKAIFPVPDFDLLSVPYGPVPVFGPLPEA